MQYKSKYTGAEIDSILDKASASNGIAIVENVSDLDPNAELGSLASVIEPGSIQESSFRDLYQPDESMLDQNTGALTAPELLASVSSISVFAPKDVTSIGFEPVNSMVYFVPRDFSMEVQTMAAIQIVPQACIAALSMTGGYDTYQQFMLAEYSQDTMSYTIHNDQVEAFNAILANGMDWCYFGYPEGGVITEEQFSTIDLFIKAVAGVPSKAHIYLKKDNWEELYKKDLEKLVNNIDKVKASVDAKADKMPIVALSMFDVVEPNTYTSYEITGSYLSYTIKLAPIKDTTICNEYVLEVKCTGTPKEGVAFHNEDGTVANIVWANGVAPSFEEGNTYIISIANGFGVYSIFPNL